MRDFAPDLFSDHRVRLATVEAEQAQRLEVLWSRHYGQLGAASRAPEACGGEAINSRNFVIHTEPAHLLKMLPPGDSAAVDGPVRLANWLSDEGIPFPQTVPTASGDLVARHSDGLACAMTYVDADHFSGTLDELRAAGEMLRRVANALDRAPESLTRLPSIRPVGPVDAALLARLEDAPERWAEWLGDETASILGENIGAVSEGLAEALERATAGSPETTSHIDLHPHNLLCRDGSVVAVLDPDSLRRADREVMLAFGALKLLRQGVAHAPPELRTDDHIQNCVRHMRDGLEADGLEVPWESWGPLSRAEVTRRIFVLLRLSIEQADTGWNHVLPVHLSALRESKRLFEVTE